MAKSSSKNPTRSEAKAQPQTNKTNKNVAGKNPGANTGEVDTKEYRSSPIDENTEAMVDVARLAYEKFVARGCVDGYDLEDWLAAEREVQKRASRGAQKQNEQSAQS